MFPEYLTFELCDEFVKQINDLLEPYKGQTKEAVIYSLADRTTLKSERRVSHKSSFRSPELRDLLNTYICPLIYGRLKSTFTDGNYDVAIGDQAFDYIKYDNGGYFERHTDFVRIVNDFHRQYTFLIGLSKEAYTSGHTILWLPINSHNSSDYEALMGCDPADVIGRKYNFSSGKSMKALIDGPFLPLRINASGQGKTLMFKSDLMHSGEEFHTWYAAKELLMLTINVTGLPGGMKESSPSPLARISEFDTPQDIYGAVPFQIIMASGEYNGKQFSDIYLKYLSGASLMEQINIALLDIYAKTKDKLNKRGRESHIASEILFSQTDMGERFYTLNINVDQTNVEADGVQIEINNYVKNYTPCNKALIVHTEKINNTWEESTCNDDGDEYDEITYLKCHIDIKFCYVKTAKGAKA